MIYCSIGGRHMVGKHMFSSVLSFMVTLCNGALYVLSGFIFYFIINGVINYFGLPFPLTFFIVGILLVISFVVLLHFEQLVFVAILQKNKVKRNPVTVREAVRTTWILTFTTILLVVASLYLTEFGYATYAHKALVIFTSSFCIGMMIQSSFTQLHLKVQPKQ